MNKSRRTEIVNGILRIRMTVKEKEPEEILKDFARNNSLFKRFLAGSPEGIDEKIEYLLAHSKTSDEWEAACRAAEAHLEKTKNIQIIDRILEAADRGGDADGLSSIFYSIKKLLIMNWDSKETVQRIFKHEFTKENQVYFAVALSEALKTSQETSAWIADAINQSTERFKAHFLAGLLLDRNHKMYFDIKRYGFLYKTSEPVIELLMEEIKERADKETIEHTIRYLAEHIESPDPLFPFLDSKMVLLQINNMRPNTIVKLLTAKQNQGVEIDRIVAHITHRKLLDTAYEYLNKEHTAPGEKIPKECVLNRIKEEIHAVYSADPDKACKILLSEGIPIDQVIKSQPENRIDTEGFVNSLIEEKTTSREQHTHKSNSLLERYAEISKEKESSTSSLIDRAICNGLRSIRDTHTREDILCMLDSAYGNQLILLLMEKIVELTENPSKILRKCLECAVVKCRSTNTKEISLKITELLALEHTEEESQIASKYLSRIFNDLPLASQKIAIRDRKVSKDLWSSLIKRYRAHEPSILSGLTNSTVLLQTPANGKGSYETQDVSGVEGECVIFMIVHLLDTKYPLQYLQIIDKMKIFSEIRKEEYFLLRTKWKCEKENRILTYKGSDTVVHIPPECCLLKDQNQLANSTGSTEYLNGTEVYKIVEEYIISLFQRDSLREYAGRALTGEFIGKDADAIKRLSQEKPHIHPRTLSLIEKHWMKPAPEVLPKEPHQKRDKPLHPTKKQRKPTETIQRSPEEDEREESRQTGILSAQMAVSKACAAEGVHKIQEKVKAYTHKKKHTASEYFFEEIERYWKTDRDKISSHFDQVIKVIKIFAKSKNIDRMGKILNGYLSCSHFIEQDALYVIKEIAHAILRKNPPNRSLAILHSTFTDKRVIDAYSELFTEHPGEILSEILKTQPAGSLLHQAAIKSGQKSKNIQAYSFAVAEAISQLHSRDDDILNSSLSLLESEYKTNPNGPKSFEIVKHAVRLLKIRTKIDETGRSALSILETALFQNNYLLDQSAKEDIISSIKYDLFHYRNILMHFLADVPASEFAEIVGKINSPTSKSARSFLRQAIKDYPPQSTKESIDIFTRIIEQAKEGTSRDRLFIIEIAQEIVEKYANGSWITVFIKVAELVANETITEVSDRLIELLEKVVKISKIKKRLKTIYKEWKTNKKLEPLVRKISHIFK